MMTIDEAVRYLRSDPRYADLVRDAYLGADVYESAERFQASGEFSEVERLIGSYVRGGKVLDLGAGTGIASRAFVKCGASIVYSVEPDPSDEVGRGAIHRLSNGLPIKVIDGFGEQIPLQDGEVDVVYAREVLHHTRDLSLVLCECARVLKDGGVFFACREHVIDDDHQLKVFLNNHPVHNLVGGENAFPLNAYLVAIHSAGLKLNRVLGPWDTVINAFPAVRTTAELIRFPRTALERRFGWLGGLASYVPGVNCLAEAWLKRPIPGRLYSFLARKH